MTRVLVGEDDADVRYLLEVALGRAGHTVRTCESGTELLAVLEADPPDLVVLDVRLAGEWSGLETVQQLRTRGHRTPVLLVSGLASPSARAAALAAGADAFLGKPFEMTDLLAWIDGAQSPSPEPSGPSIAAPRRQ